MTIRLCLIGMVLCASTAAAQAPDGHELFELNCKKCHGVRGVPPKTIKKKMEKIPVFDSVFIAHRSDDSIVKVLTEGGKTEDMKSFTDKLTREQMLAVAKYVRELALKPRGPAPE